MNVFVLTRTSGRPVMFARLRESLASQVFDGRIVHVVYSDDPSDDYVVGDVVVRGLRLRRKFQGSFPWEVYNLALLRAVESFGEPGFIVFIDDDDVYVDEGSIATIVRHAREDSILVWKVERERGRVSPFDWNASLGSDEGRVCWEAGCFHSSQLQVAFGVGIDSMDGADGRFWAGLADYLPVVRLDRVLAKPQVGKGHGRRRDE
jgi:hypothetical protein